VSSAPRDNGMRRWLGATRAPAATRFAPLVGLAVGAIAGGVYWLAAQLWPSNVALILSMLAGTLLTCDVRQATTASRIEVLSQLFYILLKYNVLMALSAAKLPFDAPPNTALCLVMICGYGVGRSLQVCLRASRAPHNSAPLSHGDLGVALLLGFSPALLLGMPGLMGLAAAVVSVIGLGIAARRGGIMLAPWIAESCFYLGAQASWSYV
jgi:cobalamin synthase